MTQEGVDQQSRAELDIRMQPVQWQSSYVLHTRTDISFTCTENPSYVVNMACRRSRVLVASV